MVNDRQETDTKINTKENFSDNHDGMSLVAARVLEVAQNPDLPDKDKLEMISEYCALIILNQP